MNIAPDRLHPKSIAITNFIAEPKDWFKTKLVPSENKEYAVEKIIVLTTFNTDRFQKFQTINNINGIEFIPYYGKHQLERTEDIIFDNYLAILESSDEEVTFIVEDDVVFLPGSIELLKDAMKQLPADWDTVSGNFSHMGKITQISPNLIAAEPQVSSMNFTGFHRRGINKIKNKLHLRNPEGNTPHNHIDRYCFSPELELNFYGVWPMICRELSGYSTNSKRVTSIFESLMQSKPYKYWFMDKPKWVG